jgi:hypothetical protein
VRSAAAKAAVEKNMVTNCTGSEVFTGLGGQSLLTANVIVKNDL